MSLDAPPNESPATPPSLLDRALRPFGEVHPGEGRLVVLLGASLFLLLFAYYLLKTVREPLILATGSAELKSYAAALQALVLTAVVPIYARFATRTPRTRFVPAVVATSVAMLLAFVGLTRVEAVWVGISFYVWLGIFNVSLVAHLWSWANDLMTREQGLRLFPLVAVGASLGSPLGAWAAGRLFDAGIPVPGMLLIAAVVLLVQLPLLRASAPLAAPSSPVHLPAQPGGASLARTLVALAGDRFLLAIAAVILLLNLVNTTGEYILGRLVKEAAEAIVLADPTRSLKGVIGAFYGDFFAVVNVLSFVFQAFVAARLVRAFGIGAVLLALPVASALAAVYVLAGAPLPLYRAAKTLENASDYSFMNTARAMLWLPTSTTEKYAVKQAIDTFVVRVGDLLSAGLVFAGTTWLSLGPRGFAALNLVWIALWIALAVRLRTRWMTRTAGDSVAEAGAPARERL